MFTARTDLNILIIDHYLAAVHEYNLLHTDLLNADLLMAIIDSFPNADRVAS
jgi:hypothetical protein